MTDDLDQLDEEVGTRLITITISPEGELSIDHPNVALWEVSGALMWCSLLVEDELQAEIEEGPEAE